jgi:hypothetical protein
MAALLRRGRVAFCRQRSIIKPSQIVKVSPCREIRRRIGCRSDDILAQKSDYYAESPRVPAGLSPAAARARPILFRFPGDVYNPPPVIGRWKTKASQEASRCNRTNRSAALLPTPADRNARKSFSLRYEQALQAERRRECRMQDTWCERTTSRTGCRHPKHFLRARSAGVRHIRNRRRKLRFRHKTLRNKKVGIKVSGRSMNRAESFAPGKSNGHDSQRRCSEHGNRRFRSVTTKVQYE